MNTNMNIETYIRERVDDQINWYNKKSGDAQTNYKRWQIAEIIAAALIPVFAPFASSYCWVPIVIALLGAGISIIESITRLYKFHENWIEYRTTCELLKYHKHLYITKSAPYNDAEETVENLFVRNIETIISSENNNWKVLNSPSKSNTDRD